MNQGYIRIGILLSVVWVLFIMGAVYIEGMHKNTLCIATPNIRSCHYFFWAWQQPDTTPVATADEPQDTEQPQTPEKHSNYLARKIAGAVLQEFVKIENREFRLQPQRVAGWIFGPLVFFWGLGFGVAWCVQGFRQQKKEPEKK